MKILSHLPMTITTKSGNIYKRIHSPTDAALDHIIDHKEKTGKKLKYIKIGVLHRNLRGKTDLHGNYYKPNVWVFVLDHEIVEGSTINLPRAQQLASYWHGGQWSALYQFASSSTYLRENHLLYLEEIEQNLMAPETALKPFTRSQKDTNELVSLKRFFIAQGLKHDIRTVYTKDKYGFDFPQLHESFPDEQVNQIKEIKRMQ